MLPSNLRRAESRVLQALLNLSGTVSHDDLMAAASLGEIRAPTLVPCYIKVLRRKCPHLIILSMRGEGYQVVSDEEPNRCTGCGSKHIRRADLCANCFKVYWRGYQAAQRRFFLKSIQAQKAARETVISSCA